MTKKKKYLLIAGIILCIVLFPLAGFIPYSGIVQIFLLIAMAYQLSFFIRRKG